MDSHSRPRGGRRRWVRLLVGALPLGFALLAVPVPEAAARDVFDDDPVARPVLHEYVDDKAPWYEIHDDLPRYPKDPPLSAFAPLED